MKATPRRHRSSDTPLGRRRPISPHTLDERYVEVLRLLEPYHHFKYLTTPWLHYLSGANVEYSVFRKYLGYMREAPNHYIRCPAQQNASPNTPYKTLVYELGERGLKELVGRGIVGKRMTCHPQATRSQRNHAFALHRSNSYYHEIIVDLGYYAPLLMLARNDPSLRLLDFSQLLVHPNVPLTTRAAKDPLLIGINSRETRFDGTPHVIVRTRADGVVLAIGIPGIQVDRGTETFAQVEKHLLHAIAFVEGRIYESHWGFDNCLIPFLFTKDARKNRAIEFIKGIRKHCAFLLFQTIPDLGLEPHFAKPLHYDRTRPNDEAGWIPPNNIHVFTNPWQRVGHPDFYFNTFDERGAA